MFYKRSSFSGSFPGKSSAGKICLFVACFVLGISAGKADAQSDALPRSTPEKEGVSSGGLLRFVQAAEKSKNEFHSIMVLRHGKVIAEGWWDPYRADLKHTLYSVSKSFTSTAIGFAVSEGRLHVTDKIVSFFPEYLPATVSPYLVSLTVKDMLCMLEGQYPDPTGPVATSDSNWVKGFLAWPIVNKPGTHFFYNTLGVYVLSAIVEKLTGEKVVDYLKPRLFDPLGIQGEDWEVSPQGINTGGWGLRLKTEDMAKVGQLYLQKGNWKGRQLLPKEWVEEATTGYNDEGPEWASHTPRDSSDWQQGYGYLFWRCRHDAFRADGAFGQLIIVMPKLDVVIAATCETPDMQDEVNLIWRNLLPAIHRGRLPDNAKAAAALKHKLSRLALALPPKTAAAGEAAAISGKTFSLTPNAAHINAMTFVFTGKECHVGYKMDMAIYGLTFGPGRWERGETPMPPPNLATTNLATLAPFQVAGSYRWTDGNTLELTLRYIESPHTETFTCHFDGNKLSVTMEKSLDFGHKKMVLEGVLVDKAGLGGDERMAMKVR